MRTSLLIGTTALGMALASPFAAAALGGFTDPATHHGLLYAWFAAIPDAADQLVMPGTAAGMLALAITIYTVQYCALLGVLAALASVGKRALRRRAAEIEYQKVVQMYFYGDGQGQSR